MANEKYLIGVVGALLAVLMIVGNILVRYPLNVTFEHRETYRDYDIYFYQIIKPNGVVVSEWRAYYKGNMWSEPIRADTLSELKIKIDELYRPKEEPSFCSRNYPNNLVETYKGHEIWRCYHARFDPHQGIVYDQVFYEKNHPSESADYKIENVRAWIDKHLIPEETSEEEITEEDITEEEEEPVEEEAEEEAETETETEAEVEGEEGVEETGETTGEEEEKIKKKWYEIIIEDLLNLIKIIVNLIRGEK